MQIKNIIEKNKSIIEDYIKKEIDIDLNYSQKIVEAMKYSLMAGGKRIRPTLFIETLKMFGKNYEDYLEVAMAIEMIHTYSLIHDDLPAMDNDSLRRGIPTNHIVYGEDIAILSGDALLNLSYEKLFSFLLNNNDVNNIKACNIISKNVGIYGMIGGQVSDILQENKNISIENLQYIHENKTAKLIMASIVSAGYIANAKENELESLSKYSYNLGMAFQVSDDILDVVGNIEELGKSIGKDEESGKNTYVKYYGIEKSKEILDKFVQNALCEVEKIKNLDISFFKDIAIYIGNRNS